MAGEGNRGKRVAEEIPGRRHADEPASLVHKVRLATPVHDDDLFHLAYKLIVNDSLHPFPRTDNPADAASSALDSSSGSSNSYDGDDARCFF